jgi:2-oxo-3-hexenedioate decarboxylase
VSAVDGGPVDRQLAEALAAHLRAAEDERREVGQLTDEHPELDAATAYEVQRIGFDRRIAEGDRPLGFKLGLTSRAKQLAMGVADPLWGRLRAGLLHDEEVPLEVGSLIHPRVEPEIAFLLGKDVDGATATTASVLAATRGVFPALEILDSRYRDFRFRLPDVIADNASAAGVVCGGRLLEPGAVDVQLEGMVLRRDGEVVDTAAGAAVSGHPAAAVAWLARRVGVLPAGSLIISGGLTAPVGLVPGATISAEFTHLGTVTLRCAIG